MTSIHISDIRTFRSCRRKWGWASPLKENREPIIPYIPFFTGKAFHAALEYYYRDGIDLSDTVDTYLASEEANMEEIGSLWPDEKAAFEEQIEMIRDIIFHYSLWQAQDTRKYSDKNLEFISLELPFEIPLPVPDGMTHPTLGIPSRGHWHPTITLGGRMDGVVRHKETGEYWIWETKTTRSVAELTNSLANDEQCGVYMYAASKVLGHPIKGVLYNIVRKKSPQEPKELQSGGLSKAKNVDTTSFHYLSVIKSLFPDWSNDTIMDQYGDILAALLDNDGKFFSRYPVYRSDIEIKNLMTNVYHTAMEMTNPQLPLYPAPSWLNCNFCFFKSACITMNAGGDHNVLLDAEFTTRKHNVSMRPVEAES